MRIKIAIGLVVIALAVSNSFAQDLEFTFETTKENTMASRALIDKPQLLGNPHVVIIATPLGNTAQLNPHPIGAWYYQDKWHIFNTDHANLPVKLQFKLQIFLVPNEGQVFVHRVTLENRVGNNPAGNKAGSGNGSVVNNTSINNVPGATIQILQNHGPGGTFLNPNKAHVTYDTSLNKWVLKNLNGAPLLPGTAYNVVIGLGGSTGSNTGTSPIDKTDAISTINSPGGTKGPGVALAPPGGSAGGDLTGSYPNPTVQKLAGKPISNSAPTVGQILRWNGTAWEPSNNAISVGEGLEFSGGTLHPQNTRGIWNANMLLGRPLAFNAMSTGFVLKWADGAWQPRPDKIGGPSQMLFKNGPNIVDQSVANGATVTIAVLTHTVDLNQKSRLVISSMIAIQGPACYACPEGAGASFIIVIDNNEVFNLPTSVAAQTLSSATISNFMIELNGGNHTVEFKVKHRLTTSPINVGGKHSSIMVIPID